MDEPRGSAYAGGAGEAHVRRAGKHEAIEEPDAAGQPSLVRPYILTAGRTESTVDLPLEAPIDTLDSSEPPSWPGGDVRAQILAMCVDHPSVAEIAAMLSLPLGVARVLIGDLVTQGYLAVRTTLHDSTTIDERRELIGRTLRGLKAL